MRDPTQFQAMPLVALPVTLEHVRDLEEHDGPLLSEFKSSDGETFLYYWCDCDNEANRWLVVRTPRPRLFRYLVGKSNLRTLISDCMDGFVYLVDLDANASVDRCWFAPSSALPPDYLPAADSSHPRDRVTEAGFQDVYIDSQWDYEDVATYPRRYLQTYAFHTAFGEGGNPKQVSLDYKLNQGWVFHTLFERMRVNAPAEKRASLAAVSFASPGFLRFAVAPEIAAGVRQSIRNLIKQRSIVMSNVAALTSWANSRDSELTENTAKESVVETSKLLGVQGDQLVIHAKSVSNAAKILASYVKRLAFLADNDAEDVAMLVGLGE